MTWINDWKDIRKRAMKTSDERILQMEGTASTKSLRQEHTWQAPARARRPVCLEQIEKIRTAGNKRDM